MEILHILILRSVGQRRIEGFESRNRKEKETYKRYLCSSESAAQEEKYGCDC